MNSILFSLYASSLHAPHMSGSAGGSLRQHATRIRALQQHKSRSTVRFLAHPEHYSAGVEFATITPSFLSRTAFNEK